MMTVFYVLYALPCDFRHGSKDFPDLFARSPCHIYRSSAHVIEHYSENISREPRQNDVQSLHHPKNCFNSAGVKYEARIFAGCRENLLNSLEIGLTMVDTYLVM